MTNAPFLMSVETVSGSTKIHPFHLGTIESVARQIAVDKCRAMVRNNMTLVSIALMRHGKIVDVLYSDGTWQSNDYEF